MSFIDLKSLQIAWNRFFHGATATWSSGLFRISLGLVLLVNLTVFSVDAQMWYSDAGTLSYFESRLIVDTNTVTLFGWFENTPGKVRAYFCVFFLAILLFTIGFYARVQAVILFVLLTSLQHRNHLMLEGEDVLMRLLTFYSIFLPLDHNFSVRSWWRQRNQIAPYPQQTSAWPLRLVQFQMTLIYVSSDIIKLHGTPWIDGTAMYYVARLDDVFTGRLLPATLLNSLPFLKFLTWSVLLFEILLPLGLWVKQTRKWFLFAAVLFHLAIDVNMNLFLFHWAMMVGLIAFLQRDDVPESLRRFLPEAKPDN
ncbi:MAG: HTTM domain-containing protein [Limisphaerales bacterium]